jgi:hypothetical protein
MKALAAAGVSLVALWCSSAQAALIVIDLLTPGDGLVTRDTDTNLDWLDPTETELLSFDDVRAGVDGWISDGWRHATTSEICDLMPKLGLGPSPCPGGTPNVPGNQVQTHHDLLGITDSSDSFVSVSGYFDDGDSSNRVGIAQALYRARSDVSVVGIAADVYSPFQHQVGIGNFLVQPVPEPSTLLLVGGGLAALSRARRGRTPCRKRRLTSG